MTSLDTLFINSETLDYTLPEDLIAQEPLPQRDKARLLVYDRTSKEISHRQFSDLLDTLKPHDALVLNKTKVLRAKFYGQKTTGGHVEVVFISPTEKPNLWRALVRPALRPGTVILLGNGLRTHLVEKNAIGENLLACEGWDPANLMDSEGSVPLPPYIKRNREDSRHGDDAESYQTVYASVPGSIAAPTAGLHFTPELLQRILDSGVSVYEVVLHVGWGTFRPIAKSVSEHTMLPENYEISEDVYRGLIKTREEGGRIFSVGTTTTRVLESLTVSGDRPVLKGETTLFIKPGFQFHWISGLITNLHVPRSTPMALTAAFSGLDNLSRCYQEAIRENYRFFSYGDAMLIL
ncbi:MAG: tRNA preQ1(34) S-adenosylmethionine ribosyltransferase-isomerase QueA [Elusimicrobia bacterium]|nr:tRNA preQ1(34) S-adenosylmethionine ribosyltransferase-isomerase QueA [Candidatus Obscuribacterium magneticum]